MFPISYLGNKYHLVECVSCRIEYTGFVNIWLFSGFSSLGMADEGLRIGGLSSGLAVILNGETSKAGSSKSHLVSYCDEFSNQSVERTIEYILGLPNKSIGSISGQINSSLVRVIIKNECSVLRLGSSVSLSDRDVISAVTLEESSVCGDIRIVRPPLLIESLAMFSSARANASVRTGKWMYEAVLETSGIQQIGWATLSCPFTDHKGVGDADDSYAFDGRRVKKWNKDAETYGQTWVVGDVIGCCIDLDQNDISFYRNGVSLGVAFHRIRKMGPGFGYYPAISLSQGERCELNFGSHPFKYPVEGYLPLQAPPPVNSPATYLLRCLSRLLDMHCMDRDEHSSVEKLRRLKRFVPFEEIFHPVAHGICAEFFSLLEANADNIEYIAWGPFMSFMVEVFKAQAPHDYSSLDMILDVFLEFQASNLLFEQLIYALSHHSKAAKFVLSECPCSGSYPYLALACHILRREEILLLWWKSSDFELLFEGFLSQKAQNKQDLEAMMPSVWWPGSHEDVSCETNMFLTTTALSETVSKVRFQLKTAVYFSFLK